MRRDITFTLEIESLVLTIEMEGFYNEGKYSGMPEDCYPPEGEVEDWSIVKVELDHDCTHIDITDSVLIAKLDKMHEDYILDECMSRLC